MRVLFLTLITLVAIVCQVAYQTNGCPRPVMEAAAACGFKHVPAAVVDACLAQIGCKPGRSAAQRAGALIDAYKDQWGWSKVECARALMHVLPGQQKKKKRTGPSDKFNEGVIWEDLPSLIEALKAQDQVQEQADQKQPRPAGVDEDVDPLVQAIVAIEGAHIYSNTILANLGIVYTCVSVCERMDN